MSQEDSSRACAQSSQYLLILKIDRINIEFTINFLNFLIEVYYHHQKTTISFPVLQFIWIVPGGGICSNRLMFSIISKNKMEESIKISLLGQEKAISKDSIFNLSPLLTEENFKLVRRPPWMDFFKPNMGVLHSCIYYTLTVEKEL